MSFMEVGLLCFDASGAVVEIVLNEQAYLARSLIHPLQVLLAPLRVVVHLGEISVRQALQMADQLTPVSRSVSG